MAQILYKYLPKIIDGVKPWISDEDIAKGNVWFDQIQKSLERHNVGIICLMRENCVAPWVLFETGALSKAFGRSKVYPFLVGMETSELKGPLELFEATTFERNDFYRLVKSLNNELGDSKNNLSELEVRFNKLWTELQRSIRKIERTTEFPSYLLSDGKMRLQKALDCDSVYLTMIGEQIDDSPFGFEQLLSDTKRKIFVSGQNLFFLTRDLNKDNHRRLIFDFLTNGGKSMKDRTVQIMVCDPCKAYAVRTWQEVTARKYKKHLQESVETLWEWLKEAKKKKISGLEAKRTVMVPLSITFVDPEESFGKMVFTTVVYEPKSEWRPCYVILKRHHKKIFNYYWTVYKDVFYDKERAKDINEITW